jgi:hypothetical protein
MKPALFGATAAVTAAAAVAAAIFAAAQAPEPGTAQAPPTVSIGEAFDYRTSHGRTLRMTLVEAAGDRLLWELHDITGPPLLAARITQDAEFRVMVHEDAAGGVTRYDPHNCEKVVGICTYTVSHPDGSAAEEMRVNGITHGVWNYSLWREADGQKHPVGIGEICYDATGLSLRESWTDLESAAGYSLERINPDGSLASCSTAAAPLD